MKFKLLASATSLLMAGAMMANGSVSAGIFWTGSVAYWAGTAGTPSPHSAGQITDADNDAVFTWGSLSGDVIGKEASIIVNISEEKFGGVDIYDVRFDFSNLAGGGFGANSTAFTGGIVYNLTSLSASELISSAAFDTVVTGSGNFAIKEIYWGWRFFEFPPQAGNIALLAVASPFLTLNSNNGSRDPNQGHVNFTGRGSIDVNDTFTTNGNGHFDDSHNYFDVTVPEPMTLVMLAIGFAAFGVSRRRAMSEVEGLLA